METNNTLVEIDISKIFQHPSNPRKDLGDLSELIASIKANGILQNLTVVPGHELLTAEEFRDKIEIPDDCYTVIIGHRRLAAAKAAGLERVPCVIAEMTQEEQLSTMLTENMQRTDLTVWEQAKSFQQLSIDFGLSNDEIAEMSGFSKTTVRHRQKLAELDEKKVKKGCERGATLYDFIELEKIEDPKVKDECLSKIGTNNWKNALSDALADQAFAAKMARWLEQVSKWAIKIDKQGQVDGHEVKMSYVRNYNRWGRAVDDVITPDDVKSVQYFYTASEREIDIYKEILDEPEETEEERERRLKREKYEARQKWFNETAAKHYKLRKDFVLSFGAAKTYAFQIMKEATRVLTEVTAERYYGRFDVETLAEMLGVKCDTTLGRPDPHEYAELQSKYPEKVMLITLFWAEDSRSNDYYRSEWDSESQIYRYVYNDNQKLDSIYYFLESLGYHCSDEELQMRRGSHPMFDVEG